MFPQVSQPSSQKSPAATAWHAVGVASRMWRWRLPVVAAGSAVAAGVLILTASCGGGQPTTPKESIVTAPDVITVTSTAFREGERIPAEFTCDGRGGSPPLAWDNVPTDAVALALVVDDPDAARGTFVHWVVLDIPTTTTGVEAGAVPSSGVQARTSAGGASYFGPCPPSGTHHYRFTVYALSQRTGLRDGADLDQALRAVTSSATGQGRLVGTYQRSG
jgi:Raf kinase inhibitor-like YbhB/YbcL family protein